VTLYSFCAALLLAFHRIVERFVLEGAFEGQLAQPPCNEQGHVQLDQVAQSSVQPDLECFHVFNILDPISLFISLIVKVKCSTNNVKERNKFSIIAHFNFSTHK